MPEAASPPPPQLLPPPASVSSPAASVLRSRRRRRAWRRPRGLLCWGALVAFFFLMNWWMFSRLQDPATRPRFRLRRHPPRAAAAPNASLSTLEEVNAAEKGKRPHQVMLTRLLALAAHALAEAESRPEPKDLWKEPINATLWKPCSDQRDREASGNVSSSEGTNGYIIISANGGINQQRVAVSSPNLCNIRCALFIPQGFSVEEVCGCYMQIDYDKKTLFSSFLDGSKDGGLLEF